MDTVFKMLIDMSIMYMQLYADTNDVKYLKCKKIVDYLRFHDDKEAVIAISTLIHDLLHLIFVDEKAYDEVRKEIQEGELTW